MVELAAPLLDSPELVRYGLPQWVQGASPAAGANFTRTVDGFFYERVVAVSFRLTPDAQAADRGVAIEYRDADDVRLALNGPAVTVPASDTTDFYFSAHVGSDKWEVQSTVIAQLDPWLLLPTFDWRIVVANIQTGDTLTRIRFLVEQFYTTNTPSQAVPFASA